jgi:hypothetical protein
MKIPADSKNFAKLLLYPRRVLFAGWWVPLTLRELGLGKLAPFYGALRYWKLFGRRR